MTVATELIQRNARFAEQGFTPGLRMMPSRRTIVIGCVDPRVDPTLVLGTGPGEVAAIRNVGGRVTPDVLDQLVLLRAVSRAAGGDLGAGWELVVLHHTDCGITRLANDPAQLTRFFGTDEAGIAGRAVTDPWAAVAMDVATLREEVRLGAGLLVSGLVYDVVSGSVEAVA